MPMTTGGMKAAILAELNARFPTPSDAGGMVGAAVRDEFAEAVAVAVVDYIKANADVVVPGGVLSTVSGGTVNAGNLPGAVD